MYVYIFTAELKKRLLIIFIKHDCDVTNFILVVWNGWVGVFGLVIQYLPVYYAFVCKFLNNMWVECMNQKKTNAHFIVVMNNLAVSWLNPTKFYWNNSLDLMFRHHNPLSLLYFLNLYDNWLIFLGITVASKGEATHYLITVKTTN